jgi:hypothetical protein
LLSRFAYIADSNNKSRCLNLKANIPTQKELV